MKQQILHLIELQNIDSELERITRRKKELPEKIAKLDESFRQAREDLEHEKKKLEEVGKAHKEKEENLKRGIEHLKKTKDRLFEVKTNKEYQAMLREIENIYKKNSEIEDEIILILENMDKAKNDFKVRQKEMDSINVRYEKERKEVEKELGTIDEDLQSLTQKVNAVKEKINKGLLKKYELIKSKSNGRAVVPVWKEICEGCHMNIPPQMYNELQKGDEILQCPFCSRIIYWENRGKDA
ncbi:MAG: zinc ribbon domain-containing protein [Syntrophales bacterium]